MLSLHENDVTSVADGFRRRLEIALHQFDIHRSHSQVKSVIVTLPYIKCGDEVHLSAR